MVTLLDLKRIEMNFRVTVRTYTGAVKTVEVNNMPDEAAARAEAVAMTFGQVLDIECLDAPEEAPEAPKSKRIRGVPDVERELKPGETEIIITGYNNNPLAVFSPLGDLDIL